MTSVPFEGPLNCYLPEVIRLGNDCTPGVYGDPVTFVEDITTNLLTIDREARNSKQYLFQTIASVYLGGFTGTVNLHVGQGPAEYLADLSQHSKVVIHKHVPDPNPMKSFANLVHNWLESVKDLDKHYLFLEDDVVVYDGWYESLLERVRLLYSIGADRFVLCLPQPSYPGFSHKSVAVGSKGYFTGSYGLFITAKAMQAIHPHVLGEFEYWRANPEYQITLDMALKYAMVRSTCNLFHCVPSLVKHIGIVCSLTDGQTETASRGVEKFYYVPPPVARKSSKGSGKRFFKRPTNENSTN